MTVFDRTGEDMTQQMEPISEEIITFVQEDVIATILVRPFHLI